MARPQATGVVLTDTLPAAATFITVTDDICSYNPDSHTVTCPVGTLAPGASRRLRNRDPADGAHRTHEYGIGGGDAAGSERRRTTASSETLFVSSYAPCSSPTFLGPFVHPLDTTSTGTLATADFNEDTFADVMYRREPTAISCCCSATALGGFAEPQYIEENNPTGATTADFNSDGHADIAGISHNSRRRRSPAEFGVGTRRRHRQFRHGRATDYHSCRWRERSTSRPAISITTAMPMSSSAARNAPTTRWWCCWVWATARSAPPISVPAGTQPGNLVLGDFNVDGHLDIAVNNIGVPTVSILRGDGEGGFSAPQTIGLPVNSQRLRQMNDVNGDGAPDLAVTTSPGGGVPANLLLLLNDGAGNFPAATEIIGPRGVGFATTGDLNGDGRLDVAAILFPENRLRHPGGQRRGPVHRDGLVT